NNSKNPPPAKRRRNTRRRSSRQRQLNLIEMRPPMLPPRQMHWIARRLVRRNQLRRQLRYPPVRLLRQRQRQLGRGPRRVRTTNPSRCIIDPLDVLRLLVV